MSKRHASCGWKRYVAVGPELLRKGLSMPMDAQTWAEFLKRNPHIGTETRDDAKCKAFLGQLGILEHFTRSKEPNLSALTFKDHPTHWIVGLLWSGYPKPEQNGYRVFCIPKLKVSLEGVLEFVQSVMDSYGGYGQEDGLIQLSPDWRKKN